jgi:hypothetical protein
VFVLSSLKKQLEMPAQETEYFGGETMSAATLETQVWPDFFVSF